MKKELSKYHIEGRLLSKKGFLLLVFVIFLFFLSPGAPVAALNDRIVAIVNDEVITLHELETEFAPFGEGILQQTQASREEMEKILFKNKRVLLDRLIDGKLIQQRAKQIGITASDKEVEQQIQMMMQSANMTEVGLREGLAKEGLSLESYKKRLLQQLLRQRLFEVEIGSRIVISGEEIGKFYADNRKFYEMGEAVRLQQIMLPFNNTTPSNAHKNKLRKKMQTIAKQLQKGKRFEEVAVQYSKGPYAVVAGNIGLMSRGMLLPTLEKVAFSLEVNEVSGIIESPMGFHIIRVTEKLDGNMSLEAIREDIVRKVRLSKIDELIDSYIASLYDKANVEIRL